MISPTVFPCPRALDPVREPALVGVYCGGGWAAAYGSVGRDRAEREKEMGISQSPAHGRGGRPMGPFFGIICMWCSAPAAQWARAQRRPLVLQSNSISTQPGAQSHDLPADLVVNRAACCPRRRGAGPSRARVLRVYVVQVNDEA